MRILEALKSKVVIAIDGPTASGKGTVAQMVADALGFRLLDSGALYRLTALAATNKGVAITEEHAHKLGSIARTLDCAFKDGRAYLVGRNVSEEIRTEEIGQAASKVSAIPEVRSALVDLQHSFSTEEGLVADGRDMGTVIFPDAVLKIYLTASAEARALRRHKQLVARGSTMTLDEVERELRIRDDRDMNRPIAPLKPASDAKIIDTSSMSAEDAADLILMAYRGRKPKPTPGPRP